MLRLLVIYVLLIIGVCGTVGAQTAPPPDEKKTIGENIREDITQVLLTDNTFVKKATLANRAEIELSQLALKKSETPAIRDFAQRMVREHTSNNEILKDIAESMHIEVPGELDEAHQKILDHMQMLAGSKFDEAYLEQMRRDHEVAVTVFSAAAGDKSLDQELIGFARRTLPVLRDHQQAVGALHVH